MHVIAKIVVPALRRDVVVWMKAGVGEICKAFGATSAECKTNDSN